MGFFGGWLGQPGLLVVPAFAGRGLKLSGVTDTCGMGTCGLGCLGEIRRLLAPLRRPTEGW